MYEILLRKVSFLQSTLRWCTPLQAMGYVRATDPNYIKGDNNLNNIIWTEVYNQKMELINHVIV